MRRYRLTDDAYEDLAEIKAYLVEQDGKRAARYVLSAVTDGFRFIADTPGAGHGREDLTDEPVKFWGVFSYLIVYDPAAKPINVIRVLHSARDLGALFERNPPRA